MKIYPKSNFAEIASTSHVIFKYVENRFWSWINQGHGERKEMYFGEDAINDKKGAIQQAIESALDEANETGSPVVLSYFDLEASFE